MGLPRSEIRPLGLGKGDEFFSNGLRIIRVGDEVAVAPSVDNREWSLLGLDEFRHIDRKLPDVQEDPSVRDKNLGMKIKRLVRLPL